MILCVLSCRSEVAFIITKERVIEIDYFCSLRSFYLLAPIIISNSAFAHNSCTIKHRNASFILRACLSKRMFRRYTIPLSESLIVIPQTASLDYLDRLLFTVFLVDICPPIIVLIEIYTLKLYAWKIFLHRFQKIKCLIVQRIIIRTRICNLVQRIYITKRIIPPLFSTSCSFRARDSKNKRCIIQRF